MTETCVSVGIGERLDGQAAKGEDAGDDDHDGEEQNRAAAVQREATMRSNMRAH
jgi:hypothetical protein